jgi:hypothetical protein
MFADTDRLLRKLSIRKMQFQVTRIDFDFDSDILDTEEMTDEDCQEIVDETMSTIWEASDEEDLIEEITCATGWCINSIDYQHVLNS